MYTFVLIKEEINETIFDESKTTSCAVYVDSLYTSSNILLSISESYSSKESLNTSEKKPDLTPWLNLLRIVLKELRCPLTSSVFVCPRFCKYLDFRSTLINHLMSSNGCSGNSLSLVL